MEKKDLNTVIREVTSGIISEYEEGRIIDKFCYDIPVKKTDGSFIQIGRRFLLDKKWFLDPSYVHDFDREGRFVAIGERNYLVSFLLGNVEPMIIEELTRGEFDKVLNGMTIGDGTFIIAPLSYKSKVIVKEWGAQYDLLTHYPMYRGIPIYYEQDDTIKDNIIIIDKNAVEWRYIEFNNLDGEKKDRIYVDIKWSGEKPGKFDLTAKIVIKAIMQKPELCRVIKSSSILKYLKEE